MCIRDRPTLDEIVKAKMHLSDLLKLEICLEPVIDNITVSTTIVNNCTPEKTISIFKNCCKITFNQETFPGVFLKFFCGTAIVFHTGKCILIGCKSVSSIETILKTLRNEFTKCNH